MEHIDTKKQRFLEFFYFVPLCFIIQSTITQHLTPIT